MHFLKKILRNLFNKYTFIITLIVFAIIVNSDKLVLLQEAWKNHSIKIDGMPFSLQLFFNFTVTVFILITITRVIASIFKKQIEKFTYLRPSDRELLYKVFSFALYFLCIIVCLDVVGIDITAFAFLGGGLGVGIGIGLQKIAANFVSGVILLIERAIKIGDLIEIDGNIKGFIREINSRYSLVETYDGSEVMVPNEQFISHNVVNWTLHYPGGAMSFKIGVDYKSDLELVQKILLECVKTNSNVLQKPAPVCLIDDFAHSSVNFIVRFWIKDASNMMLPKGEILMSIWNAFNKHGIVIPYPQYVAHFADLQTNKDNA